MEIELHCENVAPFCITNTISHESVITSQSLLVLFKFPSQAEKWGQGDWGTPKVCWPGLFLNLSGICTFL